MKKKKIILGLIVLSSLSFSFVYPSQVEAYSKPPTLGTKLQNGIRNVYYYITPSANSYSSKIKNAVHNWMYTGWDNPLYMYQYGSNYGTNMDFYAKTFTNPGTAGATSFYNNRDIGLTASQMRNGSSRHYWAKIELNHSWKNNSFFDMMIRHEMGHGFGMDHSGDKYSLMYPNTSVKVKSVQRGDSDKLIDLYGWYW